MICVNDVSQSDIGFNSDDNAVTVLWQNGERAFERLPILADALEDAGCSNADILNHLRSDGPHMRGCWPVDLILGKS